MFAALSRRFGRTLPAGKIHAHAIVLATILWIAAAVMLLAGPGDRSVAGPLKGPDFLQFYTMGHMVRSGKAAVLYDDRVVHAEQAAMVPDAGTDAFPGVYPPQVPLLFAPFAVLSYRSALLVWTLITLVVYAGIVRSAWRAVAPRLPEWAIVTAAAAAFPPFWSVVVYGQITILVMAAFWLGWLALERRRTFLAGLGLGLLAIKPQFGLALAVVVIVCGEWGLLAGALVSVAAQALAVTVLLDPSALVAFVEKIPLMLANADALEPKPYHSHSLRALFRPLPSAVGVPLWIASCAIVLFHTVRVWRSTMPVQLRFGVVVLASVLVNPHVIVYDAAVVALPLIWFAGWMREPERQVAARAFWPAAYWLFAALLAPTAAVIYVQASVLLMGWMLLHVARTAVASRERDFLLSLART